MIKIGDIVCFKYGKNEYKGRVAVFVPEKVDAFKYRNKYKEVSDYNCNFNFIEDYQRAIVVVSSGKYNSIFKAYAPSIAMLKKEDEMKTYIIQGFVKWKKTSGEFEGNSISEAICKAEKMGYEDIIRAEFRN